jgi:FkbM family methyltransferase
VQGARAAPPTARYVAIEANPDSAEILRQNVALNELDNVEVQSVAVVSEPHRARVELILPYQEPYVAPTGAYLKTGTEGISGRPALRTIEVATAFAGHVLAGADLIKLDIEGYEAQVLTAAWDCVLTNRPTIVVEVLDQVPDLRHCIRDLVANGYLAFAIGKSSLHLLSRQELSSALPLPTYGTRDIVLVPIERAANL